MSHTKTSQSCSDSVRQEFQINNPKDFKSELEKKICMGNELIEKLSLENLKVVQGLSKLEKKVRQEVKFFENFLLENNISKLKKEHLQCCHLIHLEFVIKELLKTNKPVAVMQVFNLWSKEGVIEKKVVVDIVGDEGNTWVKVVSSNPRALHLNSQGSNKYGQRSIMDQVKEFVKCSRQNPLMLKTPIVKKWVKEFVKCSPEEPSMLNTPVVKFMFAKGITSSLARKINSKGAMVDGEVVNIGEEESDNDSDDQSDSSEDSTEDLSFVEEEEVDTIPYIVDRSKLNLDITAMIAYVSSLTNDRKECKFKEEDLNEQAEWEKERPVKPFLDNLFKEKELICCESAMRDFKNIINALAGPEEKARAEQLSNRLNVVPDQCSDRLQQLDLTGKIKDRSRAIFGTGDNLKVATVTANSGFVRASKGKGVNLAVIAHECRHLTEVKPEMER